jgi:ankyrin repeat protein
MAYSSDGFTALQFACFFGQLEAAKVLAQAGSDLNAVAHNGMKVAVINTAAASGNAEIVKTVLAAGARPDHQQQAGYTALHEAALHDNVTMVKALLEAGADRAIRSDAGKTAADIAREKGNAAVLELLKGDTQAIAG